MSVPYRTHRHRTALPWLTRAQRCWPTMWRLAFVALVAALSFVLAGPVSAASAAPPPTPPASGDSSGKPSWRDRAYSAAHDFLNEGHKLHPYDRWHTLKAGSRIIIKRVYTSGIPSSWNKVLEAVVEDYPEFRKAQKHNVARVQKKLARAEKRLHKAQVKLSQAKTPKAKLKAKQAVERGEQDVKSLKARIRTVEAGLPVDIPTKVAQADKRLRAAKDKVRELEWRSKLPGATAQVREDLAAAHEEKTEAEEARKKWPNPPDDDNDDDDTGGSRPAKRSPKTPQGPGTTTAKTPKQPAITTSTTTPAKTTAVNPTTPAKAPTSIGTKTPPKAAAITGMKVPQTLPVPGKVPGIGSVRGAVVSQTVGDLLGQAYMEHMSREHQKLLDKALSDPALRKRMIAEYKEFEENNPVENLGRPFKNREFTPGELYDNGAKVVEVQKTLDKVKAAADRSNADPLYRRARTECGGYDTCVTERTRKLREKNTKDIAESTKKARKSNADPAYQQARTECGGYDTCVTERTRKLREKNTKDIAESTKKARK
ncbi:hypothetical protein ACF08N_35830, partial [Streptomyces sp. NPDC015127]